MRSVGHSSLMGRGGFTLVELMVTMITTSIVVAGVMAAVLATSRAIEIDSDVRLPAANIRNATDYLDRVIKMASYGVDPRFAIDFSTASIPSGSKDNYVGTGFVTDDLALRYRDPGYSRRGHLDDVGVPTQILLDAGNTVGAVFPAGQVFAVICEGQGGNTGWRVVRSTAATAAGTTIIPVGAYASPDPFPANTTPCLAQTTAFLTAIYEVRFRVIALGTAPNTVPYLVAYTSLDSTVTAPFAPIAENVSDFQVSYIMNRPAVGGNAPDSAAGGGTGNGNWIMGDAATDSLPNPASPAPNFNAAFADVLRFNAHPANIRAIRISLTTFGKRNPAAWNRNSLRIPENSTATVPVARDRFYTTLSTSVRVPNLASRGFFAPVIGNGAVVEQNFNGG